VTSNDITTATVYLPTFNQVEHIEAHEFKAKDFTMCKSPTSHHDELNEMSHFLALAIDKSELDPETNNKESLMWKQFGKIILHNSDDQKKLQEFLYKNESAIDVPFSYKAALQQNSKRSPEKKVY